MTKPRVPRAFLDPWQRLYCLVDRQVLRYSVVGVVNSGFNFGVFAGLQVAFGERIHYLFIVVAAHIVSVFEAYVLQRWLVFRVRGRWWRELGRFWSVYLVALGVNMVVLPLLVQVGHAPVLPAQAGVMLGTALGTFVAHRSFTFRRHGTGDRIRRAVDEPEEPGRCGDTGSLAEEDSLRPPVTRAGDPFGGG